jgi:hypothetical protein
LKFNENVLNKLKLKIKNEDLLRSKLSKEINDFDFTSKGDIIKSVSTRFKQQFSVILAQHNCISEVALILNKFNERLLIKSEKNNDFEVIFDKLINQLLETGNYTRLYEFIELYKNHQEIPNMCYVALLKNSLTRKDTQNLVNFLKLIQNSKINFKTCSFGLDKKNFFENYSVDEIKKLNECLYKNL